MAAAKASADFIAEFPHAKNRAFRDIGTPPVEVKSPWGIQICWATWWAERCASAIAVHIGFTEGHWGNMPVSAM